MARNSVVSVLGALAALQLAAAPLLQGQADQPSASRTVISALVFGDVFWMAANHDTAVAEGANGFWIRRVYFTVDHAMSDRLSVRLRFEANSPGDFTTSAKLEPFVKDLLLQYRFGRHALVVGIAPSPTWEEVEKTWGYRAVEKTPLDLQRFGSSRDVGVALRGSVDRAGRLGYHLMVGNGNDVRADVNQGKKGMLSLSYRPTSAWLFEGYVDYEDRPGATDRSTLQAFAAWTQARHRVGFQYARQHRDGVEPLDLDLVSAFAVAKVGERTSLFARIDHLLDPNPEGSKIPYLPFAPDTKATLFIAGVDRTLAPRVHLMPNAEVVVYDERPAGAGRRSDAIVRSTFLVRF